MIYQDKQYMQFQACYDQAELITAAGMPLLLKDGKAYTPNNSYGGPTDAFCPFDFINDLKAVGAKEYLIRFSPWLTNQIDFPNAVFSRHTVARDLREPIKWKHGTKSSICKNMKYGSAFDIYSGDDIINQDISDFTFMYNLTMDRKNSEQCYKYDFNYFHNMFTMLKNNIDMFKVYNFQGNLIAAATFIHDEHTAHYQFSGMDIEYAHLYPMERLISEACHYYQRQGLRLLHLGGGLAEDDSLHRFKKKFGNLELEYWTARGSV